MERTCKDSLNFLNVILVCILWQCLFLSSAISLPLAAAKSLQSCPTLSDPMDSSLPGSSVHRIVQARVLEWVAPAFSSLPLEDWFYFHSEYEICLCHLSSQTSLFAIWKLWFFFFVRRLISNMIYYTYILNFRLISVLGSWLAISWNDVLCLFKFLLNYLIR